MNADPKFIQFLVLFNVHRDYYECHDVMEELWLEEGRKLFWQGLLQAAVGLHHWQNDNFSGAVKLFRGAYEKLARYGDREGGLDLAKLKTDIRGALDVLTGGNEGVEAAETAETAPAPFASFAIVIIDPALAAEVEALAAMPLAEQLEGDDGSSH